MMTDPKLSGGCMCGSVRYETAAEPFDVSHCHCESCRNHNGALVATLAGFKKDQVTWKGSERSIYESSKGVGRAFCSRCGTPLTWEGDGGDELGPICELHVGTFDNPELLKPGAHVYETERISWFDIADDLPRHAGNGDDSPTHRGPASANRPAS
jgi:hypothetical protein